MKKIIIITCCILLTNIVAFAIGTQYVLNFSIEGKSEQITINEQPLQFSSMTQDEAEFVKGFDAKPIQGE